MLVQDLAEGHKFGMACSLEASMSDDACIE
jgi:hypothetical protein